MVSSSRSPTESGDSASVTCISTLKDLDLDAVRPYVDTLPFYGTITGTVAGSGYLDAMDLTLDWAFADARVPGNPVTLVAGDGVVGASPDSGLTFSDFNLRRSNIDLRTARLVAPAVILHGRMAASGTLDGPLRNITFRRNRASPGCRTPGEPGHRQHSSRHALRHAQPGDGRHPRSLVVRRDPPGVSVARLAR